MPGLIINQKDVQVPDLEITNYHDHPELKLRAGEDMRERHTRWIRSICWHNTKNIATSQLAGKGPDSDLEHRITRLWSKDGTHAGAHLCVDWDATVGCMADLLLDAAYHASALNEVSIGGELYEDKHGYIYEAQIAAAVKLTIWMCQRFGIQKQMPTPENNRVIRRVAEGGESCIGVFGHCHQYKAKSNDPGFHIFVALERAGFKVFDFWQSEDLDRWAAIQNKLGLKVDGIPGPKTRDALQARGFPYGLYDWVTPIE